MKNTCKNEELDDLCSQAIPAVIMTRNELVSALQSYMAQTAILRA